ncbi:MAG TPA: 3'-5' exonuclease [Pasteurellaceae bacterium]|nr:3'-5' exonuclease [Pasteurellaceae bacterium]
MKPLTHFFHCFHPLVKLEKQRVKLLRSGQCPAQLLPLFEQSYIKMNENPTALSYLAIDFETTGLNSMMDNILSIAAVPIDNLTLRLSESWHQFVAEKEVKRDTAVINHIVPQMLYDASSLDEVMNKLFSLMRGRIIIAHGSTIEKRFIQHYLATRYGLTSFPLLWLDTLRIERSLMHEKQHNINPNYQLAAVRQSYRLPEYIMHNALIDAIAAGELFLAQLTRLFGRQKKTLGVIYKRSM